MHNVTYCYFATRLECLSNDKILGLQLKKIVLR